ncbi:transposase [Aneurinibacillus sp. Ricciae_BoGa-3]|uniref:transposase n=1 Tax=Aneurinibacillus sp. Ricciae_BoGa-3 TaxID=3022697 RepID=UPI0023415434|nr:helix-turn-helix domain-containing protein [Aneurinibacillus sp. Ricciae_BoGa-3]WCK52504.1 transposase [Aneurinibacillus sp. Ricciae_BoGa-3]
MYLEGEMGYHAISDELRISSSVIRRWVRHYKNEGTMGLEEKRGKTKGLHRGRPRKNPLSLEEENQRLRAEVEHLKKLWELKR